jgi:uncharacterized membrane protein
MFKRHQDPEALSAANFSALEADPSSKADAALPVADSHTRSLLKGISWRFFATVTTMTIAWYITGTLQTALEIGFIEFFIKIGIYYLHERIWAKIRV